MKRKQVFNFALVFLMLLGVFSISSTNVYATMNTPIIINETNLVCPYKIIQKFIDVKSGGTLVINDTNNPMFCEFENYNEAFDFIKEESKDILNIISTNINEANLNKNNWKVFQLAFKEMYFDEISQQENEDIVLLNQFFTICDNHETNDVVRSLIEENNINLWELTEYLPYTSPVIDTLPTLPSASGRGPIFYYTYSDAVNYAKMHATVRNPEYNSYSADCTNFASQILMMGGAMINDIWKPNTRAWVNAHAFSIQWYTKSKSQDASGTWNGIKSKLGTGDFLIVDWDVDGIYDHVAFCVEGGSDPTIAQHTTDYCKKASQTNWPNTSGTYVVLRF